MKIRNGFVSNSSTSSFVIYGCQLDEITDEEKKRIMTELGVSFEDDEDSINDSFDNLATEDIKVQIDYNGDGLWIGYLIACPSDETGIEESELDIAVLQRTKKTLEKLFDKKYPVKVYSGVIGC